MWKRKIFFCFQTFKHFYNIIYERFYSCKSFWQSANFFSLECNTAAHLTHLKSWRTSERQFQQNSIYFNTLWSTHFQQNISFFLSFFWNKLWLQSNKCMQFDERMSRSALGYSNEADLVEIRGFSCLQISWFFFPEAFLCSAFLLFSRTICGQFSSQQAVADRQTDPARK